MLMPGVDRLSQLLGVRPVAAVVAAAEAVEDGVRLGHRQVLDAVNSLSPAGEPADECATLRLAFLISAEVSTANRIGERPHLLAGDGRVNSVHFFKVWPLVVHRVST